MGRPFLAFGIAAALLGSCPLAANAQYFGRNKVQYDHTDVRVLATEHFDLYYPREQLSAALTAGRLAERWYDRLSKALQHTLKRRQPLILYASHRTFEQTNVWSGLIDERTATFGAASASLARLGDGVLEHVVADRAVHHPVAHDE